MLTIQLGGFMSRRWTEHGGGKKFRGQVRRRAAAMGGASSSVEVRDESGNLVDYYTCPSELEELHRIGRTLEYTY